MGTPNLPARLGRFESKLAALAQPVAADAADEATAAFEALLTRRWQEDAMFLTFLETERLATDCARVVGARSASPEKDEGDGEAAGSLEAAFEVLLDGQAATMTVRGAVRDEFLESCGLSRA